jgi:hypothetical protein
MVHHSLVHFLLVFGLYRNFRFVGFDCSINAGRGVKNLVSSTLSPTSPLTDGGAPIFLTTDLPPPPLLFKSL